MRKLLAFSLAIIAILLLTTACSPREDSRCGGIAGFPCREGYECAYFDNVSDGMGYCMPKYVDKSLAFENP